ncbi:helix-turn-helix domain-containing protein [Spirosoma sp.]|uniref:helix-turn-helix domain-containing protein n=1 Tax=Spirosoma sp. TaxID=1899569 RepID=UPI003B3B875A
MKKHAVSPHIIQSISEWHQLFRLPKPLHPLISVLDVSLLDYSHSDVWKHFSHDFYCVALKQSHTCKMMYGQRDYDFNEGVMTFTKPGQVFKLQPLPHATTTGYLLLFKPDLIRNFTLGKTISSYGYFSYDIAESLHLSDSEQTTINSLIQQIDQELKVNIDHFSQDIIVSHIELLLNYANRFYNRQFITRKAHSHDLLSKVDELLTDYFNDEKNLFSGLLTVQYLADQLNVTPDYLSDMLRSLTGQTTQQHIHNKLIEKSKELLTTTQMTVSEIAYQLGFEYPQSFNKLFKNKTNVSPLEFRQSFN